MILKPYVDREERDRRRVAGRRAERQMVFYLDRQFRSHETLHVLHDVRIEHGGEVAQMDHLVVHRFGVAIVESKSVSTSVRINSAGEWERLWRGRWEGMEDAILQGERQGIVLRALLTARQSELLDRLLGFLQGTFTAMALDVFAAISEKGTIERAIQGQAPSAMKADAIPKAIEELVSAYGRGTHSFKPELRSFTKAPRAFNDAELLRIGHFLRVQAEYALQRPRLEPVPPPPSRPTAPVAAASDGPKRAYVVCKHCGSADLEPKIRYSPYVKCRACAQNTAVPNACGACGERVWLTPRPDGFDGSCACGLRLEVRFGAGAAA